MAPSPIRRRKQYVTSEEEEAGQWQLVTSVWRGIRFFGGTSCSREIQATGCDHRGSEEVSNPVEIRLRLLLPEFKRCFFVHLLTEQSAERGTMVRNTAIENE